MSYPISHCQIQCLSFVFFWEFYSFMSCIYVMHLFWVNFLYLLLSKGPTLFFYMWIYTFPIPFVEGTIFSPLNSLCRKSFDSIMRVYFYTFVYISLFMPVPHCFEYCSFLISFEIVWVLQLCSSLSVFFDYWRFLEIPYEF